MKTLLLAIFLSTGIALGQSRDKQDTTVVRISFYFQGQTNLLDPEARVAVLDMISKKRKSRLQIIEMNTFCGEFKSIEKNLRTAQERIDFLLKELEMTLNSKRSISIENFGKEKTKLNFKPKSWNRIDLYYSFHDLSKYAENFVARKSDTIRFSLSDKEETTLTKPEEPKAEKKKEVKLNIANVIPIQFQPDKAKLISSSEVYLDELYETLVENPDISAHIRGHVCCGPNFKMSKKRAKVVYKYLLKKGISAERISYRGYSNAIPIVFPERTERDRIRNRRVDVVFKKM